MGLNYYLIHDNSANQLEGPINNDILLQNLCQQHKKIKITSSKRIELVEHVMLKKKNVDIETLFQERTWRRNLEIIFGEDICKVLWHPIFIIVCQPGIKDLLVERAEFVTKEYLTKLAQLWHLNSWENSVKLVIGLGTKTTKDLINEIEKTQLTFESCGISETDGEWILATYPELDVQNFLAEISKRKREKRGKRALTNAINKFLDEI
ncbi:unnamed protein product [Caenorhabditis angaria]|uniref:Uncharacterized protein n=1 Tax=Caenorhabditis angaria TaxID=860376 RepID=A0A9P1IF40_9PELO|nr:unnamed protein product [Caenorhabditis angaria]